jgi:hypothetical protein
MLGRRTLSLQPPRSQSGSPQFFSGFLAFEEVVHWDFGIAEGENSVGEVVERFAGVGEAFGEDFEDGGEIVTAGEAMAAGDAVIGAAEFFVIAEVGKAAFGAVADAVGKDAGKKKGMISDVRADEKGFVVVGFLESGEHLEDVIERVWLRGGDEARAAFARELGEKFGDVIGDGTVIDAGLAEDVADEDVKVKVSGNAEAAALFEEGADEGFVLEDGIAAVGICKEVDERLSVGFLAQDFSDEIYVFSGELNSAVRLDNIHDRGS